MPNKAGLKQTQINIRSKEKNLFESKQRTAPKKSNQLATSALWCGLSPTGGHARVHLRCHARVVQEAFRATQTLSCSGNKISTRKETMTRIRPKHNYSDWAGLLPVYCCDKKPNPSMSKRSPISSTWFKTGLVQVTTATPTKGYSSFAYVSRRGYASQQLHGGTSRLKWKKNGRDLQLRGLKLVQRFTNLLMNGGEKESASRVLLNSVKRSKQKCGDALSLHDSPRGARNVFLRGEHVLPARVNGAGVRASDIKGVELPSAEHGAGKLAGATLLPKERQKRSDFGSNRICARVIYNVEPVVETRQVRVRGSWHQVPSISHARRRERIAVRWMLASARNRNRLKKNAFSERLGEELFDSLCKQSSSMQRKNQTYKLATNNRAYARYRWW